MMPELKEADVLKLYGAMCLARLFDENAFLLQREGRISSYAPSSGQEADQIGSAYALKPTDWMAVAYRQNPAIYMRGIPLEKILQYWGGDEMGCSFGREYRTLPVCIPIATQLVHGVGLAHAAKIKKEKIAVITYSGDGSTSEGDFNVALNWAGVFKLPIVFVVENNQYAISLPRQQQTASQTIAQKAFAFGFDGVQVDGNDVFAVYKVTKEALDKAREGGGPTLIESVTYRLSDHTTSDDASRYRAQQEVDTWRKRDPILRLRNYMISEKIWDDEREAKLVVQCKQTIKDIVNRFESLSLPTIDDIFRYTYAEMPPHLVEQLESLRKQMAMPTGSERVKTS